MTMGFELALTICIGIYLVGTLVSTFTKAKLPAMFVVSVLFLIGFWTILPKDIIVTSGMKTVSDIGFLVVLVHVGTLFEIQDMKKEWRVVVVVLSAIVGICAFVGLGITVLFGKDMALCAIPPLTGGGIATMLISQAATEAGNNQASLLAIMILTLQTLLGFPLSSYTLKKEASKLLVDFRNGEVVTVANSSAKSAESKKITLVETIPAKYRDSTFQLFCCVFLGFAANWLGAIVAPVTGNIVNKSLLGILFGIVAYSFGLIEKAPLTKAGAFPFLMLSLTLNMMTNLGNATPALLLETIFPLLLAFVLALLSIWFIAPAVGKFIGYGKDISRAMGLNCFLGYPFNHQITLEAINASTEDSKEREYLESQMIPPVIIAGVVSVSVVSVLVAGLCLGLM